MKKGFFSVKKDDLAMFDAVQSSFSIVGDGWSRGAQFVGVSDYFRELSEGEMIPTYRLEFRDHGDGFIEVKAKEIG